MMTTIKPWILASRPKTLFAGLSPVLMGLSLAYAYHPKINWPIAALTILCCLLMQVGTNLVNDYFDFAKGTDTHERIGPLRVTQAGLLSASQVKRGYQVVLALSFVIGIPLMITGGPVIIAIGIASLLGAYTYTGGPLPLSYLGLGEVMALIFFGPVAVAGTFYLQTHTMHPAAIIYGLLPGFLSWSILAVNNLRDRDQDRKNHKKTLAVRTSEMGARLIVIFGVILSQVISLNAFFNLNNNITLATLFVTALFYKTWKKVLVGPIDGELNEVLAAIGKFLFLNCLIFSAGMVLAQR